MNKKRKKLIFLITVVVIFVSISTFSILYRKNMAVKKETKINYLAASWGQNYASMDDLVKGSDTIAHVKLLDNGKMVQGKTDTIQYKANVQNALYGCEKNDVISIQMTGRREKNTLWERKEDPLMNQGEEYILFLQLIEKNTYITLTATQGRFLVDPSEKTVSSMNYVNPKIKDFCLLKINKMPWDTFKRKILKELPKEKRLPKAVMHASWQKNYTTIEQLRKESDLIALIKVKEKTYGRVDEIPITKMIVSIKRAIKGCKKTEEKEIIMTGGIYNRHYYEIEDAPLLEEDKEYLVFAQKNDDGTYSILSGAQGRMVYDSQAGQIISTDVDEKWNIKGISYQGVSYDHEPLEKVFQDIREK